MDENPLNEEESIDSKGQYRYEYNPHRYDKKKHHTTEPLIDNMAQPIRRAPSKIKNPLVRRPPYMYEDDPLRQQLSQQVNPPTVRRSSRYEEYEYEQEEEVDYYQETYPTEPQLIPTTQEKGGSQLQLINHYRRNVLQQAHQSFRLALVAAAIGLFFYIAAVSFLVLRQPESISITSLISGSLVELISAINFYLYGRASRQLASFHMYLDRTCRFLVSDTACEKITDKELRDQTLSKLILTFMEMNYTENEASETKDSSN